MTDLPCIKLGLHKGLVLAHVNVCSLHNKLQEVECIVRGNCINILAISETHLDDSITDSAVSINGFTIFRKDRNRFGGGVAIYVQNHLPVKIRHDLMKEGIEANCVQVYLPHLKTILVCCFYRPPSADALYMNRLCEMFDRISDLNGEIFLLGDMNVDWGQSCANKNNCSLF